MGYTKKSVFKKTTALFLAGLMAVGLFDVSTLKSSAETSSTTDTTDKDVVLTTADKRENLYNRYIARYMDQARPMKEIVIPAAEGYKADDLAKVEVQDSFQGKENVLVWSNDEGEVTYSFDVAEEGLYHLEFEYFPIAGKSTEIELGIAIDGEIPFQQVQRTKLDRYWKDQHPITADKATDNHTRPPLVEYDTWINDPIKDRDGIYADPYFFYLSKGSHEITLSGVKMSLGLKKLRFYNTEELPDYVRPTDDEINNTPKLTNGTIFLEGEANSYKNAPTLYATKDRTDYLTSPSHHVKERYNTVGADTWDKATQAVTWELTVENDGYYSINMRVRQDKMRGIFSNRRIYINGEVPNKTLNQVQFKYDPNWYEQELKDDNGETLYVYLKAGVNTITMEAIPGDLGEVMQRLDDLVFELNDKYRRILGITGPKPDDLVDYYVDVQIPGLLDDFQRIIDSLYAEKDLIESVSEKGSEAAALESLAVVLKLALRNPREIPQMLSTFKTSITSVSAWMRDFRNQPLELDFIEVKSVHDEYRNKHYNFFESFAFGFKAFVGSFFEDYNSISSSSTKALNVWISMSRDQATIVKELVDANFSPKDKYGIAVDINLVIGTVLEASLAGKGPEISLFLGGDFPINLAARDLLVDLTQFPDYEEVMGRFSDEIALHYQFNDGVYGLPLQQSFPMMFYRTDILEELGYSEPPKTWDELIAMLPQIQRRYLQIGLVLPTTATSQIFDPGLTFALLMLQNGQDFYTEDLKSTTFDSLEALELFKKWTNFYNDYNFDQTYDAFSRFRTGEMPIVIQNYTFYNQLSVAAPEIKGLWDFTVVPGTPQADGTINHTTNSTSTAAVIFKKVSDVHAAWTFIKWFSSTETQVQYGRSQEAITGPLGRYDTANKEALKQLPWSTAERVSIEAQMAELKEIPIIPASYAVTRNVNNAFRSVVNDGWSPAYALNTFNTDINYEILRKRSELGMD